MDDYKKYDLALDHKAVGDKLIAGDYRLKVIKGKMIKDEEDPENVSVLRFEFDVTETCIPLGTKVSYESGVEKILTIAEGGE